MKNQLTIRAADIGYGYTKFIRSVDGGIHCGQFPSVVPKATKRSMGAALGAKRDTVTVAVGAEEFEVGPDAELAQSGIGFDRIMHSDFAASTGYIALTSGALYYMDAENIDALVLGLPVNTWEKNRSILKEKFENTSISVGEKRVTVNSVIVVPQPYGGYINFSSVCNADISIENTLVIDPGFGTLDWIVVTRGKLNEGRCGAAAGLGMSSVLAALKRAIEQDNPGCEVGNIQQLDHAIRNNKPFRFYGEEIPLARYRKIMNQVTGDAIASLANNIGGTSDIDRIVLVGGPARLYEAAVRARFPRNRVDVATNPGYANVRGFQLMGQEWAARKNAQVA